MSDTSSSVKVAVLCGQLVALLTKQNIESLWQQNEILKRNTEKEGRGDDEIGDGEKNNGGLLLAASRVVQI